MTKEIPSKVRSILEDYDPTNPDATADKLRVFWLTFVPKSMAGIKAELREQQETVGIPVPVLQAIGKAIAKPAKKRVSDFIPLARLLWDEYGREGRVIAVYPLGAMELADPERLLPIIEKACRTCLTWEDADQLAMRALEPIIRKDPENWLPALVPWLNDDNKWLRRAGVTTIGRLTMKHPTYTAQCLQMTEQLLNDEEMDVKRAVSFAIRLSARGEIKETRKFLGKQVPPSNPTATWVLCDAIRSMTKKFLPEFFPLLPKYQQWATDPQLSSKDQRSIESAIKTLEKAKSLDHR
jgi:3-methyladenine DNA glycosylase AlkD